MAQPTAASSAPLATASRRAMPQIGHYDLPLQDLNALAHQSGLEWVNSNPERVAQVVGHGLQAIVEITLDRQGDEHLQAFEQRVVADAEGRPAPRLSEVAFSAEQALHCHAQLKMS